MLTSNPFLSPVARDQASEAWFRTVYSRLKDIAHRELCRGMRGTLDTTALVHELYLRMNSREELRFDQAGQFFVYASRAMRHLLINRARDRLRQKTGGGWIRITLGAAGDLPAAIESAEQALAIEEALSRLDQEDQRAAQVFELRYFAGLDAAQIAQILGVTRRTADRDWRYARAFLLTELA